MATKDELSDFYPKLLIIQYKNKPKAKAEIKLLDKAASGDWLIKDVEKCFDLDTAIGNQLDVLGRIIGLSRIIYGYIFERNYFCMDDYSNQMDEPEHKGMSDISNPVQAVFRNYSDEVRSIYTMTDDEYRKMLKLKVLINNGYCSEKTVVEGLLSIFGEGGVTVTTTTMKVTMTVSEEVQHYVKIAEYAGLLPVPLGVQRNLVYL